MEMLPSSSLLFILSLYLLHLCPSYQVHIPVVFDLLVVSSVPKDSPPPPPLQVYIRRTFHHPLDDSLLVLAPLPLPTLMVDSGLPIPFVKVYILLIILLHIIMI